MDLSSFGTVEDEESLRGVEEDLPLLETQQPVLEEQKKEQAGYGAGGFLPSQFAWIDPDNPATKSCIVRQGGQNMPYSAQIESAPFLQDDCWMVRIKWKDWSGAYEAVECSQCVKFSEQRPRRKSASVARSLNIDELLDPPDEKKKRASLSNGKNRRKKKRTLAVPAVVSVHANKARRTVSEIPMTPNNNNAANAQVSPSPISPSQIHRKSKLSEGKQDDDDFFSEGEDSYNNIVSKEGYTSSLTADECHAAPGAPPCAGLQTTTAAATTGKSFTDVAASTSSDYETAAEEEGDVVDDDDDRKPAALSKKDKQTYERNKAQLVGVMGTEQEVEAALQKVGSPYGLQAVMATIREERKKKKWTEPGTFQIEVGMRVKKPFSGAYYLGTVTQDAEHLKDEKGVEKPMWHVKYDDGDEEDLTMEELIRYRETRTRIPAPCLGRPLHCLELFCGRAIVSQEFCERKWEIASVDSCPLSNATIRKDILKLKTDELPFVPDFIWASLPCNTYSRLAGGKHRSLREGKWEISQDAHAHNDLFVKMVKILLWAKKKHPHLIVAIENPVGSLAKMPLMEAFIDSFPLHAVQVDYCAFGREEKKPTMIWSNDMFLIEYLQRFKCGQQFCQYHPGPHGVGVRGGGGLYDFSAIPQPLAEAVADFVNAKFILGRIRRNPAASLKDEDSTDDGM